MIKFPEKPDIELTLKEHGLTAEADKFMQWILGALIAMNAGLAYTLFQIFTHAETIHFKKYYLYMALFFLGIGLMALINAHVMLFLKKQKVSERVISQIKLSKYIEETKEYLSESSQKGKDFKSWQKKRQNHLNNLKKDCDEHHKICRRLADIGEFSALGSAAAVIVCVGLIMMSVIPYDALK